MNNTRVPFVTVVLSSLVVLAALCGCQNNNDMQVDPQAEKTASDVNALAKKSGGDWNKLSDSEKETMKTLQHGNEESAKKLLQALSGKTHEGQWGKPGDKVNGRPAGAPPAPK
jgi:hypothetical protein